MHLTQAQLTTLKNAIAADPVLSLLPQTGDGAIEIAAALNLPASPTHWVWRTALSHTEIVSSPSVDGTIWSWPAFIARSQGEREGWRQMFEGGTVNPALDNVRQGWADIFSGAQNNAAAQRAHLLAMARRPASRYEKLYASGTGSTAAPATMGVEGPLDYQHVLDAWARG